MLDLELYKYTDKEKKEVLKSITVLVDTREQESNHILQYFKKKKIPYKIKKLNHGDYSFFIPKNDGLDIPRDIYFDNIIAIERKANLNEIIGNLTTKRAEFKHEFSTYAGKMYLLIEDTEYQDIIEGNFDSKMAPATLLSNLHALNHKYGLEIMYMSDNYYSPIYIYQTFKYYLNNMLRTM